jgi:hypothetical protein
MGVYFAADTDDNCWLKSRMMPSDNSGSLLYSAVRIGMPGSASPPTQLLVNGNFDAELSPWGLSSDKAYLSSLAWENGAA